MYWIEATSPNGETLHVDGITHEQLSRLLPFLGKVGICSSFGDTDKDGSKKLLGGCLGLAQDAEHVLILDRPATTH